MARPVKANKVKRKSLVCNICGKDRAIINYYSSSRDEYKDYDGYCTICKDCLKKSSIDVNLNQVTPEKIKSVLYRLNKPLIQWLFVQVASNDNVTNDNFLGKYLSALNLSKEYKNSVYSDTVEFDMKEEIIKNSKIIIQSTQIEITDEIKEFWGYGKSDEKYIALQKKFDKFMENESEDIDYKKEQDYKTLTELEILKQELMGNTDKIGDLAKIIDMISKLSADLNIKAIQKKEDKNNNRHYIAGVITKFIEDVKKEPILRPSDYMKGYDKTEFEKELELYFTAPLLDSFEMTNPFKDEWEADKKKYEPTKEEIDSFANNKEEVE